MKKDRRLGKKHLMGSVGWEVSVVVGEQRAINHFPWNVMSFHHFSSYEAVDVEHRVHMFSGKVISHFGDILRSPRSPDLNTSDLLFIGITEIRCLLSQNLHMERIGEGNQR